MQNFIKKYLPQFVLYGSLSIVSFLLAVIASRLALELKTDSFLLVLYALTLLIISSILSIILHKKQGEVSSRALPPSGPLISGKIRIVSLFKTSYFLFFLGVAISSLAFFFNSLTRWGKYYEPDRYFVFFPFFIAVVILLRVSRNFYYMSHILVFSIGFSVNALIFLYIKCGSLKFEEIIVWLIILIVIALICTFKGFVHFAVSLKTLIKDMYSIDHKKVEEMQSDVDTLKQKAVPVWRRVRKTVIILSIITIALFILGSMIDMFLKSKRNWENVSLDIMQMKKNIPYDEVMEVDRFEDIGLEYLKNEVLVSFQEKPEMTSKLTIYLFFRLMGTRKKRVQSNEKSENNLSELFFSQEDEFEFVTPFSLINEIPISDQLLKKPFIRVPYDLQDPIRKNFQWMPKNQSEFIEFKFDFTLIVSKYSHLNPNIDYLQETIKKMDFQEEYHYSSFFFRFTKEKSDKRKALTKAQRDYLKALDEL